MLVRISDQGWDAVRTAPTLNGVAVSGMEGSIWISFKTENLMVDMPIPELTAGRMELDFTQIRDGIITVTGEDGVPRELGDPISKTNEPAASGLTIMCIRKL